ncbi:MAG: Abi family protein [Deltaproteobacteria bacterium]
MTPRPYGKPALTHGQQVALLERRGMVIADRPKAEFFLKHLNYYRLEAYWLPFEADHATHTFRPGTSFDQVLGLYVFDRELRLLVLDAIERVEVSVRTQWAHELAMAHGPHAHLDLSLASNQARWTVNLDALEKEVDRSEETFIQHLRATYVERLPPIWAVSEVMSLGLLSRWYSNLGPFRLRRAIAQVFRLDDGVLRSVLHHLTTVRNVCAHHGRLWNREFRVRPMRPKHPAQLAASWSRNEQRLHNTLAVLSYFLDVISPDHGWRARVIALIHGHATDTVAMGFPTGWRSLPLWKETS